MDTITPTATIHRLKQPKPRAVCSECGTKAGCECNAPYMTAGEYATLMVAEHPEKSDVALAEMCGVGRETIRRARKAGSPNGEGGTRTGRDGKQYPASPKPPRDYDLPDNLGLSSGVDPTAWKISFETERDVRRVVNFLSTVNWVAVVGVTPELFKASKGHCHALEKIHAEMNEAAWNAHQGVDQDDIEQHATDGAVA